jgi:hypothetical protein
LVPNPAESVNAFDVAKGSNDAPVNSGSSEIFICVTFGFDPGSSVRVTACDVVQAAPPLMETAPPFHVVPFAKNAYRPPPSSIA